MNWSNLFVMLITFVFINNVVLNQFLGMCPFMGVSKKSSSAIGMGAAVTFVIVAASLVTYGLYYMVLDPLGLQYMDLITFILVIAALVQLVEMIIKKLSPSLYKALGVYLPLITTNCVVLNVTLNNITSGYTMPPLAMAATRCSTSSGILAAWAAATKVSDIAARAMLIPPEAEPVIPASTVTLIASFNSGLGMATRAFDSTRKPGRAAITAPKPYSEAVFIAARIAPPTAVRLPSASRPRILR